MDDGPELSAGILICLVTSFLLPDKIPMDMRYARPASSPNVILSASQELDILTDFNIIDIDCSSRLEQSTMPSNSSYEIAAIPGLSILTSQAFDAENSTNTFRNLDVNTGSESEGPGAVFHNGIPLYGSETSTNLDRVDGLACNCGSLEKC
jgi:hypothetical protein